MRRIIILSVLFTFGIANTSIGQTKIKLKTPQDTISYCLGINFAYGIKSAGISDVNTTVAALVMDKVLKGDSVLFTAEQSNEILMKYLTAVQEKLSEKNLSEGQKFLEENKKQPGVVALPSGLQYKVVKEGAGESPAINDEVTVHYTGTLINGKIFDSSVQRGEPVQFTPEKVIPGWTEALQLMKPGSKWVLYIPSELAYGASPRAGGPIEPNMVLIFEVELLSVDKAVSPEIE